MARKKTVPTEPDILDSGVGEPQQYPEGEAPADGVQDDVLTGIGDIPDSGEMPNSDVPSDSEFSTNIDAPILFM